MSQFCYVLEKWFGNDKHQSVRLSYFVYFLNFTRVSVCSKYAWHLIKYLIHSSKFLIHIISKTLLCYDDDGGDDDNNNDNNTNDDDDDNK